MPTVLFLSLPSQSHHHHHLHHHHFRSHFLPSWFYFQLFYFYTPVVINCPLLAPKSFITLIPSSPIPLIYILKWSKSLLPISFPVQCYAVPNFPVFQLPECYQWNRNANLNKAQPEYFNCHWQCIGAFCGSLTRTRQQWCHCWPRFGAGRHRFCSDQWLEQHRCHYCPPFVTISLAGCLCLQQQTHKSESVKPANKSNLGWTATLAIVLPGEMALSYQSDVWSADSNGTHSLASISVPRRRLWWRHSHWHTQSKCYVF